MLFVYNHDKEYDKDFSKIIDKVKSEDLDIPKGSKIVVFGPEDIFWLNNVHHEVIHLRGGAGLLPERDFCKFFYPPLIRKKNVQPDNAKAATGVDSFSWTLSILILRSPHAQNTSSISGGIPPTND
jgi:hypothetical protein